MYSPKIYESQIPCLYHAAQNLEVPMTQLANAFVYYGLISGYYGQEAQNRLPMPNQVVPEGILPQMQIFNPEYRNVSDYLIKLPDEVTLNPYFQTMKQLKQRIDALDAALPGRKK